TGYQTGQCGEQAAQWYAKAAKGGDGTAQRWMAEHDEAERFAAGPTCVGSNCGGNGVELRHAPTVERAEQAQVAAAPAAPAVKLVAANARTTTITETSTLILVPRQQRRVLESRTVIARRPVRVAPVAVTQRPPVRRTPAVSAPHAAGRGHR